MTGAIVLDSSAILAHLLQEPGAEAVLDAIEDADRMVHVSSVNLCEVSSKLVVTGVSASLVAMNMQPFLKYVVSFDAQQALFAESAAPLLLCHSAAKRRNRLYVFARHSAAKRRNLL